MVELLSKLKTVVPLIATIGAVLWVPPAPGWTTIAEAIEQKNGSKGVQTFIRGMTGIGIPMPGGGIHTVEFEPFETLNPFDFTHAPYPKVGAMTRLAMEGISKVQSFVTGIIRSIG